MAKSYNNMWSRMVNPDNIEAAIHSAAKGKMRKREVREALNNVEATILRVKEKLEKDEWHPPSLRKGYEVRDGIARKRRMLVKPDFEEQIVHHLLVDYVLSPIFMPSFYEWTCGSIPGRGQESMAKHVLKKVRKCGRALKWAAVLDIKKCFESVDIEAIYKAIERRVRDKKVLHVVRLILDANRVRLPDGTDRVGGVPIGLYTSPWFINIVLSRMDHEVKDKIVLYVRYIDDMLLMHDNKRELKKCILDIVERIGSMGMQLKKTKAVFRFGEKGQHKIRFTGFHLTHERLSVRDRVFVKAVRTGTRMRRKIKAKRRITAHEAERLISYGGRFRAFGSYAAFPKNVLKGINFALMRRKVSARDKLRSKKGAKK